MSNPTFDALASDAMRNIVQHLDDTPGDLTIKEIALATGLPYNTAKVYLRRCLRNGWIAYPSRGVYASLPNHPEVSASGFVAATPIGKSRTS